MLEPKHETATVLLLLLTTLRCVSGRSTPTDNGNMVHGEKVHGEKVNGTLPLSIKDTYAFVPEGSMYLSHGMQTFLKEIDFRSIQGEFFKLEEKIVKIDPDFQGICFEKLDSIEGNFYVTQIRATPAQNLLRCHQIGEVLDMQGLLSFRIKPDRTVMLADNFIVKKGSISGVFGLLGNMVCYLYRSQPKDGDGHRRRVRGSAGAEGTEMVESPQKQEPGNGIEVVTVPNWQVITLSEERLVVHCVHDGKEYVYNMSTRKVHI
jgi:hypothetical protein